MIEQPTAYGRRLTAKQIWRSGGRGGDDAPGFEFQVARSSEHQIIRYFVIPFPALSESEVCPSGEILKRVKSSKRNLPAPMKAVDMERSMPTVPLALSLLNDLLRIARGEGFAAVKLIHGYGSSGVGGALRIAIQNDLARRAAAGEIAALIEGEQWRISNEAAWALLQRFPACKQDRDLGRANRGISIVVF